MTSIIEELTPCIEALDAMPLTLWPLWVIHIQEKIQEHTVEDERVEALDQLSSALERKVTHYINRKGE